LEGSASWYASFLRRRDEIWMRCTQNTRTRNGVATEIGDSYSILFHPGIQQVKSINSVPWIQHCDNPSEWMGYQQKRNVFLGHNETCQSLR
jgi:CO dehydrogenase/acetyl-CoA synthase beta subunit